MSEVCKNYYKLCRENAGMTQDYAAGALAISVRTLSDYARIEVIDMANTNQILFANTKKLDEISAALAKYPSKAGEAMNLVMKTATSHVIGQLPKLLPNAFGVDSASAKKFLNRRKIQTVHNVDGQSIGIEILGRSLTLASFTHYPQTPPKAGNKYLIKSRATVYLARGSKLLKPQAGKDGKLKSVFVASTGAKSADKVRYILFRRTGEYKRGLFKGRKVSFKSRTTGKKVSFRTKQGKEKIKALRSMSIPQMILSDSVSEPLMVSLAKSVDRKLKKELARTLEELGKGAK